MSKKDATYRALVQISNELNVPSDLVRQLVIDKQIPGFKDGRNYLVSVEHLNEWAARYHEEQERRQNGVQPASERLATEFDYPLALRTRGELMAAITRIKNQLDDPGRKGRYTAPSDYEKWRFGANEALGHKQEEFGRLEWQIAQYEQNNPDASIAVSKALLEAQTALIECQARNRRFAARLRALNIDPDTV